MYIQYNVYHNSIIIYIYIYIIINSIYIYNNIVLIYIYNIVLYVLYVISTIFNTYLTNIARKNRTCKVTFFVLQTRYTKQNTKFCDGYRKYNSNVPAFLHNKKGLLCYTAWGRSPWHKIFLQGMLLCKILLKVSSKLRVSLGALGTLWNLEIVKNYHPVNACPGNKVAFCANTFWLSFTSSLIGAGINYQSNTAIPLTPHLMKPLLDFPVHLWVLKI